MNLNRTIVALATPAGEGGLAVIRISGPDAIEVAQKVFPRLQKRETILSHRAVYGILRAVSCETTGVCDSLHDLDEVLALPMLAPRSYTGEDTVEFFCHGGRFIVKSVLEACRKAGAYPAGPGEFSQQAFLNGKLTLEQAEAVVDLIQSDNEYAARASLKQLRGGLGSELKEIEKPLLWLLSELEGSLEFLEEEEVSISLAEMDSVLNASALHMEKLLELVPAGRLLREGIHVVLVGPPNVGKSSLFNALVRENRALVDSEAGTTRDVVSSRIYRNKSLFVFHDTAGLRENAGRVEQMGMELTHRSIENSDIILTLQQAGMEEPEKPGFNNSKDVITVAVSTKCDLLERYELNKSASGAIVTSGKDEIGIEQLWNKLEECVVGFHLEDAVGMGVVLNERHKHKIQNSLHDVRFLQGEISDMQAKGMTHGGEEIVATMLSSLLSGLGEISGRVFSEQLLESVFRRFCIGK